MAMTTSEPCTASVVSTLGCWPADVDADFGYDLDGGGTDLVGGNGLGRQHLDAVVGEFAEESGGHLGASGVVCADEKDRELGFSHDARVIWKSGEVATHPVAATAAMTQVAGFTNDGTEVLFNRDGEIVNGNPVES